MTCFFWFESTELLNSIAESNPPASPSSPLRPLARHAVSPVDFMRWVATVLSTTQVSQNVVLLALLFVHRLKRLNPTVQGRPGSQYRLFTVALMLGNKCAFPSALGLSNNNLTVALPPRSGRQHLHQQDMGRSVGHQCAGNPRDGS